MKLMGIYGLYSFNYTHNICIPPKNGLKFVGSCIDEENHEVGLRMVSDILELDGWDTYFFG